MLTNNNQYLVTACIKGAKGTNYEPILAWYQELNNSVLTLADLLYFEAKQLPDSAPQTFLKVMAALGCGFYSYSSDVVCLTYELFIRLFDELLKEPELQKTAMKWFLMAQNADESCPGGLKLMVYSLKYHSESAENAVRWLKLLCQSDE